VGRGPVNCYTRAGVPEEPEPGIFRAANAKYRCEDMDRDGVDAELVNGPYEQISAIKDPQLRAAVVRAVTTGARGLRGIERPVHHASAVILPDARRGRRRADAGGRVRPADRGHLRLGERSRTGIASDVEPVWAAAAETGMPVNLHANPSAGRARWGSGSRVSNRATKP